ncbi:MAG: winged helix-turn-helix transcriptional regulator [Alphaproteobacteria bacterium]|nr:MAG: winged helix-turn-helix transcriptional regulator [Alphaproteobacteria bacterium]
MAVFEEARQHTDREVMVRLLTTLAENPEATQRDLATEMGISLGMMVSYMKSCVRKGFVRSKQVAPRRWAYFVTPKGFAEKSRMVSVYLYRAMTFFRDTRVQLEELFGQCQKEGIQTIAMVGSGDVAEIAMLVSQGFAVSVKLVMQSEGYIENLKGFDAVLVTDIANPQGTFDVLKECIGEDKLLSIATLCIARKRVNSARGLEREKEINA